MTNELGLPGLTGEAPERTELVAAPAEEKKEGEDGDDEEEEGTQLARDLHRLLMETTIQEGRLVCRACGHEYAVKEGIANFLLPSHLV